MAIHYTYRQIRFPSMYSLSAFHVPTLSNARKNPGLPKKRWFLVNFAHFLAVLPLTFTNLIQITWNRQRSELYMILTDHHHNTFFEFVHSSKETFLKYFRIFKFAEDDFTGKNWYNCRPLEILCIFQKYNWFCFIILENCFQRNYI